MKGTILVANIALFDRFFREEQEFFVYFEAEGDRALFDTGYFDAMLKQGASL